MLFDRFGSRCFYQVLGFLGLHHEPELERRTMANLKNVKPRPASGPATVTGPTRNKEGRAAYDMDCRTHLYTLAVTRFYGEDSFYEKAPAGAATFESLCRKVTAEDPYWMNMFVPWLRSEAGMRTSSLVAAVQYVLAGGPEPRKLVASACMRADEPGEIISYWRSQTSAPMPKGLKRGLADAVQRLYTQRAWIKWDSARNDWKFADVLKFVHPKPVDEEQAALFGFILDQAGHGDGWDKLDSEKLWLLANTRAIDTMPVDERRDWLRSQTEDLEGGDPFKGTGYTWERLAGWLPGGMDAEAWEGIIPQMYYFAMLRNLRNFEKAGIDPMSVNAVRAKLASAEDVRAARVMPLNLWTSYKVSETLSFGNEIQLALTNATDNVPALPGRTCVLVDESGSMRAALARRGKSTFWGAAEANEVSRLEAGAVFAAALRLRNKDCKVFAFGTYVAEVPAHHSMMGSIRKITDMVGTVGHSTNTWGAVAAIQQKFGPFDRWIILTDEQHNGFGGDCVDKDTPVYVCNLASYGNTSVDPREPNRHLLAGLTDKMFDAIPKLEARRDVSWDQLFAM